MSDSVFDLGDLVRCSAEFRNSADVLVDPATVTFKIKPPESDVVEYIYGTDTELIKDSTGKYHVDIDANSAGTWFYRFFSTGSSQGASEREFVVARSQF